jgi:hypothetical protein
MNTVCDLGCLLRCQSRLACSSELTLCNVDELTKNTVPIVGIGIEQRTNIVHLTESIQPHQRNPRIYACTDGRSSPESRAPGKARLARIAGHTAQSLLVRCACFVLADGVPTPTVIAWKVSGLFLPSVLFSFFGQRSYVLRLVIAMPI